MKLKISKTGSYAATFTGSAAQKCDLATVAVYHYHVVIEAFDTHLSPEGFIIENSRIQKYFEGRYSHPIPVESCERMAINSAQGIAELLMKERISILSVLVEIQGSNEALLSAKWEMPELRHS